MNSTKLPLNLQIEALTHLKLDVIKEICQSGLNNDNVLWSDICDTLAFKKLMEIKAVEKDVDREDQYWAILDAITDLSVSEQYSFFNGYSALILLSFKNWYDKMFSLLKNAINSLPENDIPFKGKEFDDFISHLMSLDMDDVYDIIVNPKKILHDSFWYTFPNFVYPAINNVLANQAA